MHSDERTTQREERDLEQVGDESSEMQRDSMSSEELDQQQASDLPDRDAMSLVNLNAAVRSTPRSPRTSCRTTRRRWLARSRTPRSIRAPRRQQDVVWAAAGFRRPFLRLKEPAQP